MGWMIAFPFQIGECAPLSPRIIAYTSRYVSVSMAPIDATEGFYAHAGRLRLIIDIAHTLPNLHMSIYRVISMGYACSTNFITLGVFVNCLALIWHG